MREYFGIVYWGIVIFVMAVIFMSVMGSFPSALFLSVMLMPGILFVKFSAGRVSFRDRKTAVRDTFYIIVIALVVEYFAVSVVYWFLYRFDLPNDGGILTNPVFICFVLASLLAIEKFISSKITAGVDTLPQHVTFFSNRKKVSLDSAAITYIESRDTEVVIRTVDGQLYPTRMKISQWDLVLDGRFVRIHRSFIVNRMHVTGMDSRSVRVGGETIEVSRKYRQALAELAGGNITGRKG